MNSVAKAVVFYAGGHCTLKPIISLLIFGAQLYESDYRLCIAHRVGYYGQLDVHYITLFEENNFRKYCIHNINITLVAARAKNLHSYRQQSRPHLCPVSRAQAGGSKRDHCYKNITFSLDEIKTCTTTESLHTNMHGLI